MCALTLRLFQYQNIWQLFLTRAFSLKSIYDINYCIQKWIWYLYTWRIYFGGRHDRIKPAVSHSYLCVEGVFTACREKSRNGPHCSACWFDRRLLLPLTGFSKISGPSSSLSVANSSEFIQLNNVNTLLVANYSELI